MAGNPRGLIPRSNGPNLRVPPALSVFCIVGKLGFARKGSLLRKSVSIAAASLLHESVSIAAAALGDFLMNLTGRCSQIHDLGRFWGKPKTL